MASYILLLTFLSLYGKTNATPQQGIIGLWSDSECNSKSGLTSNFGEIDPIALNFTLLPDVCAVPGATVHSYKISQNAICANGTTSLYKYYNSNNCTADPTDEDPNPGLGKRVQDLEGLCLALVAFNSFAFVCDGLTAKNEKFVSLSTSSVGSKTTSSSTTPSVVSIFVSITPPLQSASATSSSVRSLSASSPSATRLSTASSAAGNSSTTSSSSRSPLTASPPIASGAPVTSTPATYTPVTSNAFQPGPSAGTCADLGVIAIIGALAVAVSYFV